MGSNNLTSIFQSFYGSDASFRPGQEAAVRHALFGHRALIIQKTGWGKSLVYFLTAKILRERGKGPAIVISPLIALMDNQKAAAAKFQLRAEALNSRLTLEEKEQVYQEISEDKVDVLFIAPEFLGNQNYMGKLRDALRKSMSLLVIDEAHCISEWGHDFRPDYQRISGLVRNMPPNVPILATTATATKRAQEDIEAQLGTHLLVQRGDLMRDNLRIKVVQLPTAQEKLAWLAENLEKLPGTGIIYCLTKRDCNIVSKWLQGLGHAVKPYYSGMDKDRDMDRKKRLALEDDFYQNRLKALVATSALGMGIDKPDVGFVIHYQKPGNVIAYYQQIGRAGRGVKEAYAVLLAGADDDRINEYFINSAFPTADQLDQVVKILEDSEEGLTKSQILGKVNLSAYKLEQALKFLIIHADVNKEKTVYYKTPKAWNPDFTRSQAITRMRLDELQDMNEFIHTEGCYMQFIIDKLNSKLNDSHAKPCGHCDHCDPISFLPDYPSAQMVSRARQFLGHSANVINPRKRYADNKKIPEVLQMEPGYALSYYGDPGYGSLVRVGKYEQSRFSSQLIQASIRFLAGKCAAWHIDVVTAVPSRKHPTLVPDFAKAVAQGLGLPFVPYLVKSKDAEEQKSFNNSAFQMKNVDDSVAVKGKPSGNILLIDDMVDSRWTLTMCAAKLRKAGARKVYPFALANSSTGGGD